MRQVFTGTEDLQTFAKKLNANFAELYKIAEASGGVTIEGPAQIENKTQIPFSMVIPLNQLQPLTMPTQNLPAAGLCFRLAPNPFNTAQVTVGLIADGDPTRVPSFGEFHRTPGSAAWCNEEGVVNVVTFRFMAGVPSYEIHQGGNR